VWLLAASIAPAQPATERLARPTADQLAWHDLEVGMFIHLAPQTWQDSETDDGRTLLSEINPTKLDTDQWVRVAESMTAKYIVFVAKHEGGFCWWPTSTMDYSVKSIPWRGGRGDVLKDLSESCRKRGMKLGIYLSPQDRKHGAAIGGKTKDPTMQSEYERMFRTQLTEVLSQYGEMVEVWFDGSLVFDVGDILRKHAPHAAIFQGPQATIRWVGNEDGIVPYPSWSAVKFGRKTWGDYTAADGDPDGDRWLPNECDARIRATWFWRTDNAHTLKSVEQLMDMYYRSVGHGAVLLLNNTPDRSGLIPDSDARRSREFGSEIRRRFGTPLAETSGKGEVVELTLAQPAAIDHVITMEDISQGERVREYVIEGFSDDEWKVLARGTAIGHKNVDRIAAGKAVKIHLRVTGSAAAPVIRSLAVYGNKIQ